MSTAAPLERWLCELWLDLRDAGAWPCAPEKAGGGRPAPSAPSRKEDLGRVLQHHLPPTLVVRL